MLASMLLWFMPQAAQAGASAQQALAAAERRDWDEAIPAAKRASDAVLLKLVMWLYVSDQDSGASFNEIIRFINENPNWPDQKKLQLRAEQALRDSNEVPDNLIIEWFEDREPLSGMGKFVLADAYRRNGTTDAEEIHTLVREAWVQGDFDEPTEKAILARYAGVIGDKEHIARADRLLWEERTTAAKRMLPFVPAGHRKLFDARIALISGSKLSTVKVAQVPSALSGDAGLIFDRMRYRASKDDDKGVRELLQQAPENAPYPSKWWPYRESQVRSLVNEKKYTEAMKLLKNHGQTEGASRADALWLSGWIRCEFQDVPSMAYQDFSAMYDVVRYPVSRSRAAYWAGRAAERMGNAALAGSWYDRAGAHPTTYYGQLALLRRGGDARLSLPSAPSGGGGERSRIENSDVVQAARLALQNDQQDVARRLINLMIEASDNASEIVMLAELGVRNNTPYVSVAASKRALQQGVVIVSAGYPLQATPSRNALEPSLTLAITRQESEFNPRAKSPAGALGMMQLLKGTAKETARKIGVPYAESRLYEPLYNMELGSAYLQRMINSYDGSYVLAIAAYNAGPGNVRKWIQKFGTPENDLDNAINWIERMPFSETRNYVQRVLENLQVYRTLGGDPTLKLADDLRR